MRSRFAALAGRLAASLTAPSTTASSSSSAICCSSSAAASAASTASTSYAPATTLPLLLNHGLGAAAGARSFANPGIRVPVNRNQIDRALRDINRVCQADDILTAWRADRVFTRPAIRRVVEAKASARRLAARRFKAHMRWVMARRERGF